MGAGHEGWVAGEWPTSAYIVATTLIVAAGIGIVLFILGIYKPVSMLVVTYQRAEGAAIA